MSNFVNSRKAKSPDLRKHCARGGVRVKVYLIALAAVILVAFGVWLGSFLF